jgi:hypothetical protein
VQKSLRIGDEVCIRVVETDSIDRPRRQKRRSAAEELREQKRYVRHFAKKLGWTIRTGR